MVTLSVIVAMCDVRDYCRTALKSLALNAREDFEFIVVDDGSIDGTSEILREMVPGIPGAVLIRNERNLGISATRNIGLSAAAGVSSPSSTVTTGTPPDISRNSSAG